MKSLAELKNEAQNIRSMIPEGRRLVWPKKFRTDVLEAVAASGKVRNVAESIGVSHQTIRKWLASSKSTFNQVKIIEEDKSESNDIVLSWHGGLTVCGLNFDQLSQLLREGLL